MKNPLSVSVASILAVPFLIVLAGCQAAATPDCTANATRYQVIHKLVAQLVLGKPTAPESEAAWKRLEDSEIPKGTDVRHHDGTMSLSFKKVPSGAIESLQFSLTDVRAQKHDEKLGSWECAASFIMGVEGGPETGARRVPVTYRSELADGGRTHYVSVVIQGPMSQSTSP